MAKKEILSLSTKELYDGVLRYFDVRELVSPGVYNKYVLRLGFTNYDILARFDKRLLENMYWIRLNIGRKITANDWLWGGRFTQRVLRDTSGTMVQGRASKKDAWISTHVLASGIDYDVAGQTASEHRDWLESKSEELPHPIRLEDKYKGVAISWVHLDVCDIPGLPKVYRFDV